MKTRSTKKNKRVASKTATPKNCRGLNRALRRMESRGETASAAYDRLITLFVEKNC